MPLRLSAHDFHRTLCRIITNPTVEVIAAIAAVILASWIVVQTDVDHLSRAFPIPFGHR